VPVIETSKDKQPSNVEASIPKVRMDRPSKFKIDKQQQSPPKQKYDIFAAE
jgi:hypothetical protein